MKRQYRPAACSRERGATAVEFALVFPLFFLILYAIVTFGLIFAVQQSLTLAATEGARSALNYVYEANGSGSQALTDRALRYPGVRRVIAHVAADNVASHKVLKRAGFRFAAVGVSGKQRYERTAKTKSAMMKG